MFAIPMKEKPAENVVQAYFSVILAHRGRSVALLRDHCTQFKNKVLKEICDQLGIKGLFSNSFHPQGNAKVQNVHKFHKITHNQFFQTVVI